MPLRSLSFFGLCVIACGSSASGAPQAGAESAARVAGAAATAAASPLVESPTSAPPAKVRAATPDMDFVTVAGYLLQPGDVLQVAVWKETDLTAEVLIRPDGGMSFPLAGELHAAGHTVAELTAMLEKRVRKFEPDAVVTVVVKAAAGNRVYVIGKVQRPGDFPLNRPTDVMQALSLAGGATPFADTNGIRILRRDGDRLSSIAFRYSDVERGRRLEQNILLQSGDTVVVP
jgi:polysaccharide biosynthesis/export protein